MRIASLAAALLLGGLPSVAAAQRAPDPVPIEEWSLEKVSAMGQQIYRHDVAAWVATDALLASFGDAPPPAGMAGWIVVEDGDALKVRFLRQEADVLKPAFEIMVRDGRAGTVEAVTGDLSVEERTQFLARRTAIENIGRLRCSRQMNTVVIADPDSRLAGLAADPDGERPDSHRRALPVPDKRRRPHDAAPRPAEQHLLLRGTSA